MIELPSMLGEYLLPLLILVPLALVLVLLARRQQKEEPWQQRQQQQPPRPAQPPQAAPEPSAAPAARAAPAFAPLSSAPVAPGAYDETEPMPFVAEPVRSPYEAPPAFASDTIPMPVEEALPSDLNALPRSPLAASGTSIPVMVVDDSAVVRAKLSKLLSAAGYAVSTARHGQDALEQLQRQWVAVMITDLEMPEMDGFELIARVSGDARTQLLPIIAITGHEELQAKVQDARGLYGIFKKPWDDRELLQRVGALALLRPRSGG